VFENRVLRNILEPTMRELIGAGESRIVRSFTNVYHFDDRIREVE
jgi:hypothetical protein